MKKIQSIFPAGINFSYGNEYDQFRLRLFFAVLIFSASASIFFIAADYFKINPMDNRHIFVTKLHVASTLIAILVLYRHKERFLFVSIPYAVICFIVFVSAMFFVTEDEIRIVWFFLNIPAIYMLLGQAAGIIVSAASFAAIIIVNKYLEQPYSANAIATSFVGLSYISAFFYAYMSKSVSYYVRMNEANEKLIEIATKDPLTGIMNARAYYHTCNDILNAAQRTDTVSSVLFIDLDHFKHVNDKYGHAAGDIVLKSVADCLSKTKRNSDLLGRIGGEEFSILLPSTDAEGAVILAEKIRKNIEDLHPDIGLGVKLRITASIGISVNEGSGLTINEIQAEADKAMYEAKAQGRNRVTCFKDIMYESA